MANERKTKQPREVDDFDIICTRRLGDGDTIASDGVTATYTGPDNALVIDRCTSTDVVAKIWIAGGTNGKTYKITAMISTTLGRLIEADFNLLVKDT